MIKSFKLFVEKTNNLYSFMTIDERLKDYSGMFSVTNTQGSIYSDYINDEYIRGYFYFYKGFSIDIEMISPKRYLEICAEKMGYEDINDMIYSSKTYRIKELVNDGVKLDMPFLNYVSGFEQEGRNRCKVAMDLGEELIPVAIIKSVSYKTRLETAKLICNLHGITPDNYDKLTEMGYHRDVAFFIKNNLDELC